jgi:hypothetical protein
MRCAHTISTANRCRAAARGGVRTPGFGWIEPQSQAINAAATAPTVRTADDPPASDQATACGGDRAKKAAAHGEVEWHWTLLWCPVPELSCVWTAQCESPHTGAQCRAEVCSVAFNI